MNEKYYASAHQFIMWATFSEEQNAKLFHIILVVACPPGLPLASARHLATLLIVLVYISRPRHSLTIFRPTLASPGPGPGPGLVSPRASFYNLTLESESQLVCGRRAGEGSRGRPRYDGWWWRDGRLSDDDGCDAAPQLILMYTLLPPQKLKCHQHQIVFILYNYKYLMWCIELLMQRVTWPADMTKTPADMTSYRGYDPLIWLAAADVTWRCLCWTPWRRCWPCWLSSPPSSPCPPTLGKYLSAHIWYLSTPALFIVLDMILDILILWYSQVKISTLISNIVSSMVWAVLSSALLMKNTRSG